VLRATLSEARADLDPASSVGRLVAQGSPSAPAEPPAQPRAPLALDVGYGFVSFAGGGPLFGGLAVRGSWRPRPRLELALATAALGSVTATTGTVDATATIVPVHAAVRRPFGAGPVQLIVGPCVDATYIKVSATSTTSTPVPVRSPRNLMIGLGAEGEARFRVAASAWLFARFAALGVLNGQRYDVNGSPVFDTSRLELAGSIGAGRGLP